MKDEKQPTVASPIEPVVSSELIYRDFEDHGTIVVGFECTHCDHGNFFNGEDADCLMATGEKSLSKVECSSCKKESTLEQE